jgi:hypothetical protein
VKALGEAAVHVSLLGDDDLKDAADLVNDAVALLVQAVGSKERDLLAGEKALTEPVAEREYGLVGRTVGRAVTILCSASRRSPSRALRALRFRRV